MQQHHAQHRKDEHAGAERARREHHRVLAPGQRVEDHGEHQGHQPFADQTEPQPHVEQVHPQQGREQHRDPDRPRRHIMTSLERAEHDQRNQRDAQPPHRVLRGHVEEPSRRRHVIRHLGHRRQHGQPGQIPSGGVRAAESVDQHPRIQRHRAPGERVGQHHAGQRAHIRRGQIADAGQQHRGAERPEHDQQQRDDLHRERGDAFGVVQRGIMPGNRFVHRVHTSFRQRCPSVHRALGR